MDSTGYMSCVLEVDTKASGWHKTMTKVLKGIKGVSYSIDAETGITHVSGKIDPETLLNKLAKAGKHADLRRVDSHSDHQYYAPPAPLMAAGMVNPNYATYYNNAYDYNGYGYGYGSYYDHHGYGPYQYHDHHYGRMMDHYHPPDYKEPQQPRFPQSPPVPDNSLYNPDTLCIIM